MKRFKFKDIKFKERTEPRGGIQAILNYGKYNLSIVRDRYSYGGKEGLYEIGAFLNNTMIELPGITEEGDTVKGWLSEDDITGILLKMVTISGVDVPKQVAIAE
tara:strand:- start:618 stop:929 length:312 start_codon:yes stop_codon:yes gene_type:complete